tara:strand:- start:917 stop:1657 length:741 start_codon:yes stop_codon:yes gene_type:complete
MSKNVVFMTCMENAPDILDYKEWCFKSWRYWCDKNDVQLFILDQELQDKTIMKPTWQRWHAHEVLEANNIEYEQVALVDIDTMIHWDAPNFFDLTDGEFSAVQDKFYIEWSHNSIKGYKDFWPDVDLDWTTYFNCGFIVMSKKHKDWCKSVTDFYYANETELRKRQHETLKKGSDQTPINYMIRASEHKLNFLNDKYNLSQLHMRGVLQGDLLWETGFVWHFNGFEKTQRNALMKQVWEMIEVNYK